MRSIPIAATTSPMHSTVPHDQLQHYNATDSRWLETLRVTRHPFARSSHRRSPGTRRAPVRRPYFAVAVPRTARCPKLPGASLIPWSCHPARLLRYRPAASIQVGRDPERDSLRPWCWHPTGVPLLPALAPTAGVETPCRASTRCCSCRPKARVPAARPGIATAAEPGRRRLSSEHSPPPGPGTVPARPADIMGKGAFRADVPECRGCAPDFVAGWRGEAVAPVGHATSARCALRSPRVLGPLLHPPAHHACPAPDLVSAADCCLLAEPPRLRWPAETHLLPRTDRYWPCLRCPIDAPDPCPRLAVSRVPPTVERRDALVSSVCCPCSRGRAARAVRPLGVRGPCDPWSEHQRSRPELAPRLGPWQGSMLPTIPTAPACQQEAHAHSWTAPCPPSSRGVVPIPALVQVPQDGCHSPLSPWSRQDAVVPRDGTLPCGDPAVLAPGKPPGRAIPRATTHENPWKPFCESPVVWVFRQLAGIHRAVRFLAMTGSARRLKSLDLRVSLGYLWVPSEKGRLVVRCRTSLTGGVPWGSRASTECKGGSSLCPRIRKSSSPDRGGGVRAIDRLHSRTRLRPRARSFDAYPRSGEVARMKNNLEELLGKTGTPPTDGESRESPTSGYLRHALNARPSRVLATLSVHVTDIAPSFGSVKAPRAALLSALHVA